MVPSEGVEPPWPLGDDIRVTACSRSLRDYDGIWLGWEDLNLPYSRLSGGRLDQTQLHPNVEGHPWIEQGTRGLQSRALPLDQWPKWWTRSDLNRQPSACKADALPIGATGPNGILGGIRTRNLQLERLAI